jgi:EAL domain-containing protein (putative c-di-GMP-specific phosphodiesterase class I)
MEALVRWRQPGAQLLAPAAFIPVAEDTGLIRELGGWVLEQACRDARRWYGEHGVAVTVNVSGRQLDDPAFGDIVVGTLARTGLDGRALIIEITESSLVDPSLAEDVRHHLHRLREEGVRVAIDDFGTGYSSLSYVAKLPVDIVKVDKSLIGPPRGQTARGRPSWAFTKAVLDLIASLDLVAVVEGVETGEQAEALSALGAPLVQGYHFSPGVPAEQIDASLAQPAWS